MADDTVHADLAARYRRARKDGDSHADAIAAAVDGYEYTQLTNGHRDQGRDDHADAESDAYYRGRLEASPLTVAHSHPR